MRVLFDFKEGNKARVTSAMTSLPEIVLQQIFADACRKYIDRARIRRVSKEWYAAINRGRRLLDFVGEKEEVHFKLKLVSMIRTFS